MFALLFVGGIVGHFWDSDFAGTEKLPITVEDAVHSLEVARESHIYNQPDDGWVEKYSQIIDLILIQEDRR